MAWFNNQYRCDECGAEWEDEWSCCCDDECPECQAGDWQPYDSENLSAYVERIPDGWEVYYSHPDDSDQPNYNLFAIVGDEEMVPAVLQQARDASLGL
ncbi:hypothetical protein [Notoacmeibacter marinus]|uniref:hypothetical protein n=1 Tax=Notoacmeibacter marinus TaxID=1876515 RepID=UPI000DF2C8BC|nr:hypothetical protein [Notoacmeibacter marinus]